MPTIKFTTPKCPHCGKTSTVELEELAFDNWVGGMFIQDAFPQMSPDEREVMITGTHPECWDKIFPPEEDEK